MNEYEMTLVDRYDSITDYFEVSGLFDERDKFVKTVLIERSEERLINLISLYEMKQINGDFRKEFKR